MIDAALSRQWLVNDKRSLVVLVAHTSFDQNGP